MTPATKVEVFSAGCSLCTDAVQLVQGLAGKSGVEVVDMRSDAGRTRAKAYGVTRVPAVVVDGRLAECCQQSPVRAETLRAALSG
jgi:glutaredoxin 3